MLGVSVGNGPFFLNTTKEFFLQRLWAQDNYLKSHKNPLSPLDNNISMSRLPIVLQNYFNQSIANIDDRRRHSKLPMSPIGGMNPSPVLLKIICI